MRKGVFTCGNAWYYVFPSYFLYKLFSLQALYIFKRLLFTSIVYRAIPSNRSYAYVTELLLFPAFSNPCMFRMAKPHIERTIRTDGLDSYWSTLNEHLLQYRVCVYVKARRYLHPKSKVVVKYLRRSRYQYAATALDVSRRNSVLLFPPSLLLVQSLLLGVSSRYHQPMLYQSAILWKANRFYGQYSSSI